ncbi:MAG: hypothetical protein GXP49_07485 [Deltaproteobacteria bacterium]|nr:hypothetical protein [Deltaproteobacteria bacterium]
MDKSGTIFAATYSADFGDLELLSFSDPDKPPVLTSIDGAPSSAGSDPDVGRYADLAVGKDGSLHLSYYDAQSQSLRYAVHDLQGWKIQVVDHKDDAGRYSSIALDTAGRPLIAYAAGHGTAMQLRLAWKQGSTWKVQVVDIDGSGEYASLIVMPQGGLRIAYYDLKERVLKLAAQGVNGFGSIVVDDGKRVSALSGQEVKHDVGRWCSAAVSTAGDFGIAYFDATEGSLLFARPGPDGKAAVETIDSGNGNTSKGQFASLAFDRNQRPVVAYQDSTNLDLLVAFKDGKGWHTQAPGGAIQVSAGFWTDIMVGDSGAVYICHYLPGTGKNNKLAGTMQLLQWNNP